MAGSTVAWNGTSLARTFVSATQLMVQLPALTGIGPALVTVTNAAPGGGTSTPASFFVSANGATATSASGTSTDSGGTAFASVGGAGQFTPGSLTGQATGAGTLTLAQLSASPVTSPLFGPEGGWFDLHVSAGNAFSSVSVADCNLGSGHEALWWTGSAWQLMSNQAWDPGSGCLTMTFTASTSPSIAQLNGTPAMVWEWARNVGIPACIGDEFIGSHGNRLPTSVDELDSWGNAAGLRNTSTGAWSCVPNLPPPAAVPVAGEFQRSDTGQVLTWADIDSQLRGANYNGVYDHGSAEITNTVAIFLVTQMVTQNPTALRDDPSLSDTWMTFYMVTADLPARLADLKAKT